MKVEYTGRQTVVTQKYRDQGEVGLKRIDRIVSEAATAHVVLTIDKYRKIAEVTVTDGSQSIVATGESAEMSNALREALVKIEQQAIRQKQKSTTTMRHPRPVEKAIAVEPPDATGATA